MTLYQYTGLKRRTGTGRKYEAPDELYVNGKTLTSVFAEGVYRQLTVTGRGLKPFYVETTDYLNRSGASINSVTVDPIEFDIKYRIQAKDDEELRATYERLQQELSGILTISFADDRDYVYEDVVMTFTERDPEDRYNLVGLFTLTAYKPYRIGKQLREESVVSIQAPSVPVEKVNIIFNESISNPIVELYDGMYWSDFTVNASVSSGDTLTINIDEEFGRVTFGGSVSKNAIKLGDLPQNMVFFNGAMGRVKDSSSSEVTLGWRDVRL